MTALHTDAGFEGASEGPPLAPATARELRRMMKDWRHGRATRNLWEVFHDAYIGVLAALMIGAMLVNVVLQTQRVVARCSTDSCLSARAVLPWAAFGLAVALALVASRLFGPVLASAAEGFWLLDTPVSRSQLLGRRLLGAVMAALVGGALVGALISALTGSSAALVLAAAGVTGVSAAAAVAFAAAQQGVERWRLTRFLSYVFTLLGLGALFVVVGVAAEWFRVEVPGEERLRIALGIGAAGALTGVVSYALARIRLPRIRRSQLTSGGALVGGMAGAFFALDIGLARDIMVARRAVEIGHVRPARGHGIGLSAITWREWQRLRRFPRPLLVVAATVIVPYASDALGMSAITPFFAALVLFAALIPMLGGLRVLTRSGGLARSLPFSTAQIKLASVTIPAVVAALWAVAVTAAFRGFGDGSVSRSIPEATLMAVATAAAGLLGAIRWTQAKGVDFGAPMIATQAGAFPPGLMTNLFRGFDMCLLITAPMLLGLSPFWSLAIAAIAAGILLSSLDAETVRARQAEQQRQIEQQRKQREAAAAAAKQRKR